MNAADLYLHHRPGLAAHPGLGVRPGESDPARMLCRVLVLLTVTALMAVLALAWWLV
jgi:hypothetical protein